MSNRKYSKIDHAATPYDIAMLIGGKHFAGGRERRQTTAKLAYLSDRGLDLMWQAVTKHAAPSVRNNLAAQGINAQTFPSIVKTLYRQEQPRRGGPTWAVVMSADEKGIRVLKRMKRFAVITREPEAG